MSVEANSELNCEVNPDYLLPDTVWERVRPLLPPERPKPKGGRPQMDDRKALNAIFYILRTGCQWKTLPRSLGAPSTVHDRFQAWVQSGLFSRLWQVGLKDYAGEVGIEGNWLAMDGALVKAPLGRKATGPNPTDRDKSGTERSLLVEGRGIPLAIVIDGANCHDMKLTEATLEAQPIVPCDLEPEEHRHLCLDKEYDYVTIREVVKAWGYEAHIPPRDESQRMIRDIPNYRARRWVVERTHS
jgi:putative transposase